VDANPVDSPDSALSDAALPDAALPDAALPDAASLSREELLALTEHLQNTVRRLTNSLVEIQSQNDYLKHMFRDITEKHHRLSLAHTHLSRAHMHLSGC
jgi:hypothetical protein